MWILPACWDSSPISIANKVASSILGKHPDGQGSQRKGECIIIHAAMRQFTHIHGEKFWGWPQPPQGQMPEMSIYTHLVIDFLGKKMPIMKG